MPDPRNGQHLKGVPDSSRSEIGAAIAELHTQNAEPTITSRGSRKNSSDSGIVSTSSNLVEWNNSQFHGRFLRIRRPVTYPAHDASEKIWGDLCFPSFEKVRAAASYRCSLFASSRCSRRWARLSTMAVRRPRAPKCRRPSTRPHSCLPKEAD